MDKVVYFLGAGFSAPLGLPVMSNFLIKSKDMYFSNPELYSHFKDVFDTINEMAVSKNYFKTDLFNIEEILSILEMRQRLGVGDLKDSFLRYLTDVVMHFTPTVSPSSNFPSNWHRNLFSSPIQHGYAYFVASLMNLTLEMPSPSANRPVRQLVAKPSTETLTSYSVVTLNYDSVIENFAKFFGGPNPGYTLSLLPIAKLHGCVEAGGIIPPTWNKAVNPESASTWQRAFGMLKEANHIRIIGYSLPTADSYVKYLLRAAAIETPHLKSIDVICYDPRGDAKRHYDEFIDFYKYRFVNCDVTDYLLGYFKNLTERFVHSFEDTMRCEGLERFHDDFFRKSLAV